MRQFLIVLVCLVLWSCKNEISVQPRFVLPSISSPIQQGDVVVVKALDKECDTQEQQMPLLPNAMGAFVDFN